MSQHLSRNLEYVLRHREGLSLCLTLSLRRYQNSTLASYVMCRRIPIDKPLARIVSRPMSYGTVGVMPMLSSTKSYNKYVENLGQVQWPYTQTCGYLTKSGGLNARSYHTLGVEDFSWNEIRREFYTGIVTCCAKPEKGESDGKAGHIQNQEPSTVAEDVISTPKLRLLAPSKFDRRVLVWTGKYSSLEAVPSLVSDSTLNWAKNKFRVYVNIFMMAMTFGTAVVVMVMGRRGESLSKVNMMRHPNQYQEALERDNAERSQ